MPSSDRPGDAPTVLVVEDDRDLADTYSLWLESEYDVRTAYSGSDGLTWYDPSVDVVLLDRRIPDFSGTSVLRSMSAREIDDQKALLTGVEPGRELVDLPCDDYVMKPVTKTELRDTVRELQMRSQLGDELQRHFTLTSKIVALESSDEQGTDAAAERLRREVEKVRARIEDRLDDLGGFESAFRALQ